jgi:PAS domain S-box-containing protein
MAFSADDSEKFEQGHRELINFFNAMDAVFFSVDPAGRRVTRISDSCVNIYGYTADEFLENDGLWLEVVYPDDRQILEDTERQLHRGESVRRQFRAIRKDGVVRWVEERLVPVPNGDGRLLRIDGIVRDITEQRAAAREQKELEAWSYHVLQTAQEGIWTINANDETDFVNQKMCDILGYEAAEMMGRPPWDFMDEKGQIESRTRIGNRKRGINENTEARYLSKTGEVVWVSLAASPILEGDGKYKGSLAMITDITRRKKDEEALKKSEANLRAIFDNTDSSYILVGPDLKIISFNALAQRFSVENNGKVLEINKEISFYFTPERRPFVKETLEKVAQTGETVSYEISYPKADGSVQWNNVRWLNVKDSDNQNRGFILANKDVTEAKTAMLERERVTADLIQHIKDLEQFTYIISHNLRAPVANIMGLSEMLKEDLLDPAEKQEVVDRVSSSIRHIDGVIQDLNHILQARVLVNEKKEEVYFIDLVNNIKTSIYNTVAAEKVGFDCTFPVASIFSVKSYLYSIFYNLISNSIKYRRHGIPPVITIESRKVKDKIELKFSDNGKGIDLEKNAGQLFGLYKRFDTSMEGKGMGLFMVKTQVEAIGGTIKIKSQLDQGTEFIIQFGA